MCEIRVKVIDFFEAMIIIYGKHDVVGTTVGRVSMIENRYDLGVVMSIDNSYAGARRLIKN